jgi:hypothetical protein
VSCKDNAYAVTQSKCALPLMFGHFSVVSGKLHFCLAAGSKVLYSSSSSNYEFFFTVFTLASK